MKKFRPYVQEQGMLHTIIPDKLLEPDHPARVISGVVDKLDLSLIYACYDGGGRPAYHPLMMFKTLFYSYFVNNFSSRNMAHNLKHRADYIYLSGYECPGSEWTKVELIGNVSKSFPAMKK